MEFTIKQKLPSLNEYINACRTHWAKGAEMKKELEYAISCYIYLAKQQGKLRKVTKPVRINFTWIEKNRKRDKDNVASAKKFILDALTENGILKDDGNNYIKGFSDTFIYGADYAVNVEIIEI